MTAQQPPNSKRTGKRVGIGARPPANPHAEAWIRQGDADALGKGDLYTARLTLDITPAMRARIKVSAFTQGVTVADLLRGLLEREFPSDNTPSPHSLGLPRTRHRLRCCLRFRHSPGRPATCR